VLSRKFIKNFQKVNHVVLYSNIKSATAKRQFHSQIQELEFDREPEGHRFVRLLGVTLVKQS